MMRGRLGCVIAICGSALLPGPVRVPRSDDWETLNQEVMSLYKQGKYDRAVEVAKKALEVAERDRGPDHPNVDTVLENLSELHMKMGKAEDARKPADRPAKIRDSERSPESVQGVGRNCATKSGYGVAGLRSRSPVVETTSLAEAQPRAS